MTEDKKRPRGRPATGRKRYKTLNMKFTEEERMYLKNQAKIHDLTLSDYFLTIAKEYEKKH
ncbi:hypothetical protein QP168_04025 [Aerococcus urinae]|uniref:CopG family transcriptional regulator n=1 Tax=Aerococcus mictus TaxID=2976810 RepID=A0A1E9PFV9_9LACT|nr:MULTISPECIES: hypothetical protein [Aerococcus]KAA9290556.1 hypothetical protein F6I06_08395 [Aerococcus mictus]MBU5609544.1 hypothetical protein [Aerococcus urinae]MCY3033562.1 hypothetical protein [Aerococcus mictus]MCY3062851.1 hypothetical protein [Aerococcus mictus]MCY3065365.1 hypothetical protein [Aerococcus mictus]